LIPYFPVFRRSYFQGPRQERITVEELLRSLERDYEIRGRKSLPQLKAHLRHIRSFFILNRALAVSAERLRDYVALRQQEKAASATINRELEGLQRAFTLAVEAGTLSWSPVFPSLREDNARQGFFDRPDFEAVLGNLKVRGKLDRDLQDFLSWLYWTGMRPGEIRALTWAALDCETWTLRLHAKNAKTGYGRVLPLEQELLGIIKRRIEVRLLQCPYIFHRQGRPVGEYRKVWNEACKQAGLTGKIPYDLRRTAVRNMVRAGVPERVAMAISGHRTRSVFDRYNIISENDMREAVRKTDAYVGSLSTISQVVTLRQKAI
jgi:integrase